MFETHFSELITICNESAKQIFINACGEMRTFTDVSLFMPKQIASKPSPDENLSNLQASHMAHLLQLTIFKNRKIEEV